MDKQFVRLIIFHLAILAVFWTGVSVPALIVTFIFFCWRGLALSIAYHRYFAHRSFKTSRAFQCFLAASGSICMQRGALWWASNHRRHHQYSDTENDPHSPVGNGFWHSHMGWALKKDVFKTDYSRVKDYDSFPELRWLNEKSDLIHVLFAVFLFALGEACRYLYPHWGANGPQFLVWGYLVGGLAHLHSIFLINSWCHIWGERPYDFPAREGRDNSHNVPWIALITFGEGYHYNHHCFPASSRFGHFKGEFDASWITLRCLEKAGIIWDLKTPSDEVLKELKFTNA